MISMTSFARPNTCLLQHLMISCGLQLYVEGPDVAEERRRVEALGTGDASTAIVLRDLCKVYPSEVRIAETQP